MDLRRRPGPAPALHPGCGPSGRAAFGGLLCAALLAGCGGGTPDRGEAPEAAPATRAADLAGCYDVELGGWEPVPPDARIEPPLRAPAPDRRGDSLLFAPPPRLRLDTIRAERTSAAAGRTLYELRPAPGAVGSVHRLRAWRPAGTDSVRLIFSTGFAGVRLRLAATDGALRGRAETFTDIGGKQQHTAPASLSPVPCDAPLAAAARTQRKLPGEVVLEDSRVLRLGARLPDGPGRVTPSRGARRDTVIRTGVVGLFRGAEEIEARTARGDTVASLRLHYPRPTSLDSVLARLRRELGPPTTESRSARSAVRWANRSVSVFVTPHGAGGRWAGTVTLLDPRGLLEPRGGSTGGS